MALHNLSTRLVAVVAVAAAAVTAVVVVVAGLGGLAATWAWGKITFLPLIFTVSLLILTLLNGFRAGLNMGEKKGGIFFFKMSKFFLIFC